MYFTCRLRKYSSSNLSTHKLGQLFQIFGAKKLMILAIMGQKNECYDTAKHTSPYVQNTQNHTGIKSILNYFLKAKVLNDLLLFPPKTH